MFWLCCSGGEELPGDLVPGMSSSSVFSMWRRGSNEQLRAGASLDGAAGASGPKWLCRKVETVFGREVQQSVSAAGLGRVGEMCRTAFSAYQYFL